MEANPARMRTSEEPRNFRFKRLRGNLTRLDRADKGLRPEKMVQLSVEGIGGSAIHQLAVGTVESLDLTIKVKIGSDVDL